MAIMCPCNRPDIKDEGIACAYHTWYTDFKINQRVARELDISVLEISKVDMVLFMQTLAIIEAEAMAKETIEPTNPTVH